VALQVQGHADERDTTDFNLALGQRRAQSVAGTLVELGVPRQRVQVTSFGEERPVERGGGEGTWSKNRRVEILVE
jgi:peptidoglycan-associated lipoprotein